MVIILLTALSCEHLSIAHGLQQLAVPLPVCPQHVSVNAFSSAAALLNRANSLVNAYFGDLNHQQISQHRRWIPAVLVTIFQAVESLHLLLVEFP
jgi:hypothetical protein